MKNDDIIAGVKFLYWNEGRTPKEIAEILKLSIEEVEKIINK